MVLFRSFESSCGSKRPQEVLEGVVVEGDEGDVQRLAVAQDGPQAREHLVAQAEGEERAAARGCDGARIQKLLRQALFRWSKGDRWWVELQPV